MAIAPQFQNYNQPSYGQQYGQQQQYGNQMGAYNVPGPQNNNDDFFSQLQEFLFGQPERYQQINRFNPQGNDALSRLLSSGQQNMQNPYEGFEPLAQETRNDYFQNILPQLTEMFGSRTNGRASSPQFQSALAAGGSGLAAMLNAQKARYGQQNKQFGLEQTKLGLQQPYETFGRPSTPGFINQLAGSFQENAGNIAKLLPLLL